MISFAVRAGIEIENFRRAEMGLGRPLATSFGEEPVVMMVEVAMTAFKLDVENAGSCDVRQIPTSRFH